MKKLLAIALCAIFAIHVAEGRTIYVNAKRPNNKGNGLKVKSAKKTIQAAINIAKKGDTILVYPGTYAPFKTDNKKITIKSVKGQKKTKLVPKANIWTVAELAKTEATGNATVLSGFLLDGTNYKNNEYDGITFSHGGTLKSCAVKDFNVEWGGFSSSKLENCLIQNNYLVTGSLFWKCSVKSTKILKNRAAWSFCNESTFVNCLITGNTINGLFSENSTFFRKSTLLNCTVVDNTLSVNQYVNSTAAKESKFYNSILWNNYRQESGYYYQDDEKTLCNADTAKSAKNTYKNTDTTNKDPKFTSAYKLKKGSYAINKGKLTAKQKKLVGTKDLAGKKRIKGKAIDRGCYEY